MIELEAIPALETFNLDIEAELSYHQHMSNEINEITDPELLEQIAKLRYYEPADTRINPNFGQEWLSFVTWAPDRSAGETSTDTQRINELGQKLHNMTNELFPAYEGNYVGLCDNVDKLFSGETVRKLLSQMTLGGGHYPSFILYVPSRYRT